jgi:hypothetical protein
LRAIGICLLGVVVPILAFAKTPSEVFGFASPSVVVVRASDAQGKVQRLGSGVVIASDQVVTNCHVVDGSDQISVRPTSRGFMPLATVTYRDMERDICQLTTTTSLVNPPARLGSVEQLKVGSRVYAIGAPQGLELSLSEGIVSSLRPTKNGEIIQTTAPISQGSSGGGLFDDEGLLVGITTFSLAKGQNLNFALPVDWIAALPRAETSGSGMVLEMAWLITKIAIYTFILSVLFRQTYNLIFVMAKRPATWITVVALFGVANMGLAYALSWDPRLVSAATLTAILLNISPSVPKGFSKTEFRATIDAVYEAMGITQGRLKSRIGLIVFGFFSLAAYVFLFSEICTLRGECAPMMRSLFS